MHTVLVFIDVKPDCIDEFIQETRINTQNSIQEPGIARFDVIQDPDVHHKFLLVEAYHSDNAPAQHKETAHYQRWKTQVEGMLAAPRTKKIYQNIFPNDQEGSD